MERIEHPRSLDSVLSEEYGHSSRKTVTFASGQEVQAGTVLGQLTEGGSYLPLNLVEGTTDGSERASAILLYRTGPSDTDRQCVVLDRDCAVKGSALRWPLGMTASDHFAAVSQLATRGILVR